MKIYQLRSSPPPEVGLQDFDQVPRPLRVHREKSRDFILLTCVRLSLHATHRKTNDGIDIAIHATKAQWEEVREEFNSRHKTQR